MLGSYEVKTKKSTMWTYSNLIFVFCKARVQKCWEKFEVKIGVQLVKKYNVNIFPLKGL